jgi:streptomycin 6-kinase
MDIVEIPARFVATTLESRGEAARSWLAELPGIIEDCVDLWALTLDGPVWHGFMGVALPARLVGGESVVLKVSWVDEQTRWEPVALAAWNGGGAVRLLARDDTRGAMLLERLDPSRTVRELEGTDAAVTLGQVCRRLAIPAPPDTTLPRVCDLAKRWEQELAQTWERLGRPLTRPILESAVATCRELGAGQPDTLLHGDLVFDNILRAEREPWLVIDPQGLRGEPAFDGAQFLGNRWSDHVACGDIGASVRRRLAAFADGAQVEYERARRWAVARLTVDALWCREHQADAVAYVDTMIEALHIPGR